MPRKDNPEWTEKDFAKATRFKRGVSLTEATKHMIAKRGRPAHGEQPKVRLSLRVDPAVLHAYQATGDGWQGLIAKAIEAGARKLGKPAH